MRLGVLPGSKLRTHACHVEHHADSGLPDSGHSPLPDVECGLHAKYRLGTKLSTRAFSQVRTAVLTGLQGPKVDALAVKIVDLRDRYGICDPLAVAEASGEVRMWHDLGRHEHIVRLHDVLFERDVCYFVMERCPLNLLQYLEGMQDLTESVLAVKALRPMVAALAHLQDFAMAHRDVKPDNFLASQDGVLKLCDFGLSLQLPDRSGLSFGFEGVAGTPPFMSPEMLEGQLYGLSTDIWSLGVVAYVLLYGNFPYKPAGGERGGPAMKRAILCQEQGPRFRSPALEGCDLGGPCAEPSMQAELFVKALLCRDPVRRVLARDALETLFLKEGCDAGRQWHLAADTAASPDSSFRPNLQAAVYAGAFEQHKLVEEHGLDEILTNFQQEHQGQHTEAFEALDAGSCLITGFCDPGGGFSVYDSPLKFSSPMATVFGKDLTSTHHSALDGVSSSTSRIPSPRLTGETRAPSDAETSMGDWDHFLLDIEGQVKPEQDGWDFFAGDIDLPMPKVPLVCPQLQRGHEHRL